MPPPASRSHSSNKQTTATATTRHRTPSSSSQLPDRSERAPQPPTGRGREGGDRSTTTARSPPAPTPAPTAAAAVHPLIPKAITYDDFILARGGVHAGTARAGSRNPQTQQTQQQQQQQRNHYPLGVVRPPPQYTAEEDDDMAYKARGNNMFVSPTRFTTVSNVATTTPSSTSARAVISSPCSTGASANVELPPSTGEKTTASASSFLTRRTDLQHDSIIATTKARAPALKTKGGVAPASSLSTQRAKQQNMIVEADEGQKKKSSSSSSLSPPPFAPSPSFHVLKSVLYTLCGHHARLSHCAGPTKEGEEDVEGESEEEEEPQRGIKRSDNQQQQQHHSGLLSVLDYILFSPQWLSQGGTTNPTSTNSPLLLLKSNDVDVVLSAYQALCRTLHDAVFQYVRITMPAAGGAEDEREESTEATGDALYLQHVEDDDKVEANDDGSGGDSARYLGRQQTHHSVVDALLDTYWGAAEHTAAPNTATPPHATRLPHHCNSTSPTRSLPLNTTQWVFVFKCLAEVGYPRLASLLAPLSLFGWASLSDHDCDAAGRFDAGGDQKQKQQRAQQGRSNNTRQNKNQNQRPDEVALALAEIVAAITWLCGQGADKFGVFSLASQQHQQKNKKLSPGSWWWLEQLSAETVSGNALACFSYCGDRITASRHHSSQRAEEKINQPEEKRSQTRDEIIRSPHAITKTLRQLSLSCNRCEVLQQHMAHLSHSVAPTQLEDFALAATYSQTSSSPRLSSTTTSSHRMTSNYEDVIAAIDQLQALVNAELLAVGSGGGGCGGGHTASAAAMTGRSPRQATREKATVLFPGSSSSPLLSPLQSNPAAPHWARQLGTLYHAVVVRITQIQGGRGNAGNTPSPMPMETVKEKRVGGGAPLNTTTATTPQTITTLAECLAQKRSLDRLHVLATEAWRSHVRLRPRHQQQQQQQQQQKRVSTESPGYCSDDNDADGTRDDSFRSMPHDGWKLLTEVCCASNGEGGDSSALTASPPVVAGPLVQRMLDGSSAASLLAHLSQSIQAEEEEEGHQPASVNAKALLAWITGDNTYQSHPPRNSLGPARSETTASMPMIDRLKHAFLANVTSIMVKTHVAEGVHTAPSTVSASAQAFNTDRFLSQYFTYGDITPRLSAVQDAKTIGGINTTNNAYNNQNEATNQPSATFPSTTLRADLAHHHQQRQYHTSTQLAAIDTIIDASGIRLTQL